MDFHWVRMRATAHPTEDLDKVRQALATASRLEEARFAAGLEVTPLETHHGATQHLLEVTMQRNRDCKAALDAVLVDARDDVATTLDDRVDDDGILYVRLDKQQAYAGRLVVGVFDDPVLVRAKLQVHPASREKALAAWRAFLDVAPRASPAL